MIELTVISLFIILLLAYFTMGRNLSRPTILYVGGFFICSTVAWSWKDEWGLETMSPITAFIIIGGALMFYIVEWLDYMRSKSYNMPLIDISSQNFFYVISPIKLFLILIFQVLSFAIYARAKMSFAGSDDLVYALGAIDQEAKFENVVIKLPAYASFLYNICLATIPIWCYLLPYYISKASNQYKFQILLLYANLIVIFIGGLLTGGRTILLRILITYAFCWYLCYQNKNRWKATFLPSKMIVILTSLTVLFVSFFGNIGDSLGRKENNKDISMLFAIYCGAQIKNLDDYIVSPFEQDNNSGRFAQYTMCGMYDKIDQRLFSSDIGRKNHPNLVFNNYDGYLLGNVYTTYYNFLLDFGCVGTIFVTGIMSLITVYFYRKTIMSRFWQNGKLSIIMLFFGSHFPNACFQSFLQIRCLKQSQFQDF